MVFLGTSYGSNLLLYYDVRYYGCDITVWILRYTPAFPLAAHRVNFAVRFAFSFCICLVAKTRSPLSPNRGSVGGRDARTNNLIYVL